MLQHTFIQHCQWTLLWHSNCCRLALSLVALANLLGRCVRAIFNRVLNRSSPLALSLIGLSPICLANSVFHRIPALLGKYRDGLAPFGFGTGSWPNFICSSIGKLVRAVRSSLLFSPQLVLGRINLLVSS